MLVLDLNKKQEFIFSINLDELTEALEDRCAIIEGSNKTLVDINILYDILNSELRFSLKEHHFDNRSEFSCCFDSIPNTRLINVARRKKESSSSTGG